MSKPKELLLKCSFCGFSWKEPVSSLLTESEIVYRVDGDDDTSETVDRRIPCRNCPRNVIVTVPKVWTEE
jgi:hypothetical protein